MNATSLGLLENLINRTLQADPDSTARLARMRGRCIRFESFFAGDLSVFATFSEDGVRLDAERPETPDAVVRGGPFSFLRSAARPKDRSVFADGTLAVEGDATLVQEFADLLRLYRPDWQSGMERIAGEALTGRVERGLENLAEWRQRAADKFAADGGEYLTEETRLVVDAESMQRFNDAVDDLAAGVARLEQRLARLEGQGSDS